MQTQLPNLSALMPFAVFGVFSAMAWLVVDFVWGRRRRAEQRLDQLRHANRREPAPGENSAVANTVSEWFGRATPQLAKPLQPKTQQEVSKLKLRLAHGGFRADSAPTAFLAIKVLCLAVGLLLSGGGFLLTMGLGQTSLLRIIMVTCMAFFVPDIVLYILTKRRKKQIFLGLPDALDLMVVSVEAGLGLDQAMRKVAVEMRKSFRVIAHEFSICNMQLQMGWPRDRVLRDLGYRNGERDLQSLSAIMIQACRFGSGIGQALRVQSDTMRVRRRQIAEEKAAKCAVKLIFPLVLFIFPGVFVVLVGPAAVNIIRQLLPTMAAAG